MSPKFATSINTHVPFSLSWIMMSGLLLGMDLSVCTFLFHHMVTLPSKFLLTNLVCCHTSVHCLILPPFPCIC